MPPGHSQLIRSLQPLSVLLTCDEHLLSTHDVHAWLLWDEARHELPPPPPLLLLEHANAASAAVATAPAINAAFIINADLLKKCPPPWTGCGIIPHKENLEHSSDEVAGTDRESGSAE